MFYVGLLMLKAASKLRNFSFSLRLAFFLLVYLLRPLWFFTFCCADSVLILGNIAHVLFSNISMSFYLLLFYRTLSHTYLTGFCIWFLYQAIHRPGEIWHFLTMSYNCSRGRILTTMHEEMAWSYYPCKLS